MASALEKIVPAACVKLVTALPSSPNSSGMGGGSRSLPSQAATTRAERTLGIREETAQYFWQVIHESAEREWLSDLISLVSLTLNDADFFNGIGQAFREFSWVNQLTPERYSKMISLLEGAKIPPQRMLDEDQYLKFYNTFEALSAYSHSTFSERDLVILSFLVSQKVVAANFASEARIVSTGEVPSGSTVRSKILSSPQLLKRMNQIRLDRTIYEYINLFLEAASSNPEHPFMKSIANENNGDTSLIIKLMNVAKNIDKIAYHFQPGAENI